MDCCQHQLFQVNFTPNCHDLSQNCNPNLTQFNPKMSQLHPKISQLHPAIIREQGPNWKKSFGSFILTASHNPGGPEEDFGVKYNCENGGPAPEALTNTIYEVTRVITAIRICNDFPDINTATNGSSVVKSGLFCLLVSYLTQTLSRSCHNGTQM
jgi:Phosphoglucomutase/phosphomannomutase, alpha/beta/alpha domain I